MSIDLYCKLIDEICAEVNIPNPERLYQEANLKVDDVAFTLLYGSVADPNSMMLYCDFGELPEQGREAVLLRLMETNMHLFGANSPCFTYNSESKHIVLAARLRLFAATGEDVLRTLRSLAAGALEWRQNHFLHETEQKSGKLGQGRNAAQNSTLNRLNQSFSRPGA